MTTSPFGQYAAIVAVFVAGGAFIAWLATVLGFAPQNQALDAVMLIIVGAVFGTGAGALTVANGVGKKADTANTRLDAMRAPSGPVAEKVMSSRESEHDG